MNASDTPDWLSPGWLSKIFESVAAEEAFNGWVSDYGYQLYYLWQKRPGAIKAFLQEHLDLFD